MVSLIAAAIALRQRRNTLRMEQRVSGSIAQFEFETAGFLDSARDRAERVNEHIGSMSLARWLSAALRARGYETSEPWGEDHGCDFSLTQGGKTYICACYSDDDEDAAPAAPLRKSCRSRPAAHAR